MRKTFALLGLLLLSVSPLRAPAADDIKVIVLGGIDETVRWMESIDWWMDGIYEQAPRVPRALLVATSATWAETANDLPVEIKKQLFYRAILPLILHANAMVRDRRDRLQLLDAVLAKGTYPNAEDLEWLRGIAQVLRIDTPASVDEPVSLDDWRKLLAEALYKLDEIPAGLALGQAAFESGYGTSRFVVQGNALFGQWSYGGDGMVPEGQRKELGDHRIASYDWGFDSVRAYFLNINSHPAHESFRRIRADLRAAGQPLTSLALADGLVNYSERGQEYVEELKSMIRFNHLDLADGATSRDEPLSLVIGAGAPENVPAVQAEIDALRASGEAERIFASMRLE